MHVPPPLQITVTRFAAWRWSILGVVVCAWAAWGGWAAGAAPTHGLVVAGSGLVLALCGFAVMQQVRGARPVQLRWDTQVWHLGQDRPGAAPQRGHLGVAIDLGAWMLLFFTVEGRPRGWPTWVPVQRRGHESAWHSLRCAAYGARPASGALPAQF